MNRSAAAATSERVKSQSEENKKNLGKSKFTASVPRNYVDFSVLNLKAMSQFSSSSKKETTKPHGNLDEKNCSWATIFGGVTHDKTKKTFAAPHKFFSNYEANIFTEDKWHNTTPLPIKIVPPKC
jgi:hypothetical protein